MNAQQTLGGLDITVRRNAFGRQVDSFETELDFTGLALAGEAETPVHAVFIRAPWVERVGESVQVLASVELPADGQNGRIDSRSPCGSRSIAAFAGHLLPSGSDW